MCIGLLINYKSKWLVVAMEDINIPGVPYMRLRCIVKSGYDFKNFDKFLTDSLSIA